MQKAVVPELLQPDAVKLEDADADDDEDNLAEDAAADDEDNLADADVDGGVEGEDADNGQSGSDNKGSGSSSSSDSNSSSNEDSDKEDVAPDPPVTRRQRRDALFSRVPWHGFTYQEYERRSSGHKGYQLFCNFKDHNCEDEPQCSRSLAATKAGSMAGALKVLQMWAVAGCRALDKAAHKALFDVAFREFKRTGGPDQDLLDRKARTLTMS